MLERILIYTVVQGSVYALIALGFCLIFGVARVLNMAHAAFSVLAAYILFDLISPITGIELGFLPGSIIAVVGATLLGVLSYKFCIDRVREHHGAVLLITIALGLLIEQALTMRFLRYSASVPLMISGYTTILGVRILKQYLLIIGIVVGLIVALELFLSKTKMGIAIRAVANDTEVANLMGISPSRILLITMAIATGLAGVAGVVLAPEGVFTSPSKWGALLLSVMVIVVIGGLGSLKGSIIGAFIVAFVEALCIQDPLKLFPYGAAYMTSSFVLLAMVIVLIVRPAGLFGTMFEEEKL